MSEQFNNQIVDEFLDTYFSIVNSEVENIFERYYEKRATYDEIGTYYGTSRQAVQQKVDRNIKNMRNMLAGKSYKQKYASEEVIRLKADIDNLFNDDFFFTRSDLKDKCNIDFSLNSYNIKIFLDIIDVYLYSIDENYIFSYKRHTANYLDKLYKTIIGILNENVLGIDEFSLITNAKKRLNNSKINNEEIISLCASIDTIEVENDKYRLTLNKLTSYDKKAMRILEQNNKPMDGREIASIIFNQSGDVYTDEKVKAVINAMTNNKYIDCIGKTGSWALNIWEYESSFHVEIIKKVFQKENGPLSAREIYAKVCIERPDLTLSKIQAYLYSNNEIFLQINQDMFIISTWKKKFIKEINKYNSMKNINKNFDIIVLDILEKSKKQDLSDMVNRLHELGVTLSESRIRVKLGELGFVSIIKEGNKYYYCLNDKKEDPRKKFLDQVMGIFREAKNGIENRGADVTLKDGDEPKGETAIQIALYEMMRGYFYKEDIDVTREAWTGRGPVDFKFSRGFNLKVFLEVKLAKNQNLFDGLEAQLTQYMGSEVVKYGIFIVVLFEDDDLNKIKEIKYKIKGIEAKYKMIITFEYIDARGGKPSPSKLKKGDEDISADLII